MQFVVKTAGIADGFTLVVPPPEGGSGCATVGTTQPDSPGNTRYHSPLWFRNGSGGAIHLVVETTCVAQVVAGAIPAPQGRGDGATVDAFSGFTEPSILRRVCRPRQGSPLDMKQSGQGQRQPLFSYLPSRAINPYPRYIL